MIVVVAGRLLETCTSVDQMRGIEGAAAKCYFAHFDDMISPQCPFQFIERSRRPPRNEVIVETANTVFCVWESSMIQRLSRAA